MVNRASASRRKDAREFGHIEFRDVRFDVHERVERPNELNRCAGNSREGAPVSMLKSDVDKLSEMLTAVIHARRAEINAYVAPRMSSKIRRPPSMTHRHLQHR